MTVELRHAGTHIRYHAFIDGLDIGTVVVDAPMHGGAPMVHVYGVAACTCTGRVFNAATPMDAAVKLLDHAKACEHFCIANPTCAICHPDLGGEVTEGAVKP